MKVLIVEPGRTPRAEDIRNELDELQAIVGGWIETVTLEDGVALICDEDGKLKGYRANRYIKQLRDIITGTFILAGVDEEECEFTDLPDAKVREYTQKWGASPCGR